MITLYLYIYTCLQIDTYAPHHGSHKLTHMYVCTSIYAHKYIYIFYIIYMYTYTHMYTYTYTYIYISLHKFAFVYTFVCM